MNIFNNLDHTLCRILRRINRFVVEVIINNRIEKAHINNTGRLEEFLVNGRIGYCLRIRGKKLKYRLFAIKDKNYAALIDTNLQEKSFIKLLSDNNVPWLKNCVLASRNIRLNSSIIDFLVKCDNQYIYTELKSAVLRYKQIYAAYPDCPTIRGRRQIRELIKHVEGGGRSLIVFIAALPHVKGFKPYKHGDPVIAELLREAEEKGVLIKAINIYYDPIKRSIVLANPDLPVLLN
ncbi:DNA/RNA nuclease SfsA [Staphylothermus hellenicus]|uniref:Sugar fermentation stimulation protein n=1 Tax=Staphylothermus hellenicus (strain DSM 12710 / JCM 10830 / BK20S6-10-b1 / P8) TaxID=591019 RepID=D7D9P5_STAHD|nr:DNA/RNA nuclease SfsA [Staphylothermus hellenicus]ADI32491.1 sugar fermentation stimulation protein [Staphylothermus hellenicus DSM 12710]